jgi:nucleoside-diphosphate-sugar epimerase
VTAAGGPVLVTGATGFIGRAVVAALPGALPYRTTSRTGPDGPTHQVADLTRADEAAAVLRWADPAVVIHLAGGRAPTVAGLYAANVSSTACLLLAAAYSGRRPHVIVVGSAAEYGVGDRIAETAPISPSTPYGRAKTAQVALARRLAGREGIPLTVVRPFEVVGPGLPASTPLGSIHARLVAATTATPEVRCGRLDVVRDYVSIGFVASVLIRLAVDPRPDRILNICSGTGLTLGAVATAMAAQLGLEPVFRTDPGRPAGVPIAVGDPSALAGLTGLRYSASPESVAAATLGRTATPVVEGAP